MSEVKLSRTQRNEIFELIRRHNLDPEDFEWSSAQKSKEVLRHRPTKSWFEWSEPGNGSGFWLSWWPHQGAGHSLSRDWEHAREVTWRWLAAVRADYEAPDLWSELAKGKSISSAAKPEYAAQFTPAELKLLETGLADIERYVTTTQPLEPEQKEQVKRRFAYLRDAANAGVRKVDWLNIFVGQIVSMVTERLLDAKFYGPLMAHAGTALNAVFQFGLKMIGG